MARQVVLVGEIDQHMVVVTLFEQELRLRLESDATLRHRIVIDDALLL